MNSHRPEIVNRGQPNREYVRLRFSAQVDLSFYVVLLNRLTTRERIGNGHLSSFWFPSIQVSPLDEVHLYSCGGTPGPEPTLLGGTIHRFYWGFPQTVWHDHDCVVVLAEIAGWETALPGPNAVIGK